MKIFLKILAILLALVLLILFFYVPQYLFVRRSIIPAESTGEELVLMSTNIYTYAPLDLFKRSWFYRADLIAQDVDSIKPDVIGFQEVANLQFGYLEDIMDGYDFEEAYRDNNIITEGCPIFWNKARFDRIDGGVFWLSETPETMSKDWGSKHHRICVYVVLHDKQTNRDFAVFNTHLDHASSEARIKGIEVVLNKIHALGDLPSFLLGDMNAKEDSKAIRFAKNTFDDSKEISPITEDTVTFHAWGNPEYEKRIDFIFVSKNDARVLEYHVLNNNYNGVYSSDHSSVYIKTRLT